MPQTATSGQLENAQNIAIAAARYTQEHESPSWGLIEKMRLAKGEKTRTVPKVGTFTLASLTDGEDMTQEQEIGMTTVDLSANEVGGKIIATDKLLRQNATTEIMKMLGRQFGDAAARKYDTDTQALYANMNGGTAYGLAGKSMSIANFAATIAKGRGKTTNPFTAKYAVQHPHATYDLVTGSTPIGTATNNFPDSFVTPILKDFWKFRFDRCNVFDSGNLSIDASADATGFVGQKDALVGLESKGYEIERERDASRRAWEMNYVADYGVFELDDSKGAPIQFDATAPSDSA